MITNKIIILSPTSYFEPEKRERLLKDNCLFKEDQTIVRSGDKGTLFERVSSFNNKLVVAEEVFK